MKQVITLFVIALLGSFCSTAAVTLAATEAVAVTSASGLMSFEVVNGFALVARGITAATAAAGATAPTASLYATLALGMLSPILIFGGAVAAGQEVLL